MTNETGTIFTTQYRPTTIRRGVIIASGRLRFPTRIPHAVVIQSVVVTRRNDHPTRSIRPVGGLLGLSRLRLSRRPPVTASRSVKNRLPHTPRVNQSQSRDHRCLCDRFRSKTGFRSARTVVFVRRCSYPMLRSQRPTGKQRECSKATTRRRRRKRTRWVLE